MKKRILIGSNGGLTGIYLARRFGNTGKYEIYGTDSNTITAGRFFVDKQVTISGADDDSFTDELIYILKKNDIDYYFPTHSKEIKRISRDSDKICKEVNTKFIVSPIETFEKVESKESAYYSLSKSGIPTPYMIAGMPEKFPVFMKNKIGSGGGGSRILKTEREYEAYKDNSDVCFFEVMNGKEYTIDCIFDCSGKLLIYNSRERIKTIGGAVSITENAPELDILPYLRKLEENWIFKGCVNFQCIVSAGIPYFTDINLRYASGGLPLSVNSGMKIEEILIRLLDGEKIKWGEYTMDKQHRQMYRYFEEIYADNSAGF